MYSGGGEIRKLFWVVGNRYGLLLLKVVCIVLKLEHNKTS